MTTTNDAPENQPAAAPAGEGPVPIQPIPPAPPEPPRLTAERLGAEVARLDGALVFVVLLFAFFLASFRANNSDLWQHLAAGRLLAQGQYTFGTDPFAYTTEGSYWVNHAWLTDLVLYGTSQLFGGPESAAGGAALVVGKALLVVVLAGVLLLIRRPGQGFWLPAVSTALGLLVLSPRLHLQPTVFSFLGLALTLFLLQRPADGSSPRGLYLLPVLFAVWVNLDSWFLLGPLTVWLYLLGETLQKALTPVRTGPDASSPAEHRTLALVSIAGLAACLLNPHHVRAFALPPELSAALSPSLRGDGYFSALFLSPFDQRYLTSGASHRPEYGQNIAAYAYFVLVGFGLASFLLNSQGWRWWRALVWVTFFLLSALMARAVGFFAVASVPVITLNLQDFAARRFGTALSTEPQRAQVSLYGRLGTLLALLGLVAAAWPGWLHPWPDDGLRSRHVSWSVYVEPSLREAAGRVRELYRQGVLSEQAHAFNFTPEVANYFAWFCPEEKSYYDFRYPLFGEPATQTYLQMRQALAPRPTPNAAGQVLGGADLATLEPTFRHPKAPIDHVIISGADWPGTLPVVYPLWTQAGQWTTLYADGRTVVLGWNHAARPDAGKTFRAHAFDPSPRAFGADLPEEDRVPEEAPRPPQPRTTWEQFAAPPTPRPLDIDRSVMLLDYYATTASTEQNQAEQLNRAVNVLDRYLLRPAAGLVDAASGGGLPSAACTAGYQVRLPAFRLVLAGPPPAAPPLLAVRAARRGVAAKPDEADGRLALGRAAATLGNDQRGRGTGQARWLDELRQAQTVTALRLTLDVKPNTPEAHQVLAETYRQVHLGGDTHIPSHLDLAAEHWLAWLRLTRANGPLRGEPAEEFTKRLAGMEQYIAQQLTVYTRLLVESGQLSASAFKSEDLRDPERLLQKWRTEYDLKTANLPPLDRADIALRQGLAGKALEVFVRSPLDAKSLELRDFSAYEGRTKVDVVKLLMRLLLSVGRTDMVREMVRESGIGDDYWLNTVLAAADGDYDTADENLAMILQNQEAGSLRELLGLTRAQLAPRLTPQGPQSSVSPEGLAAMTGAALSVRYWADLRTVRGLLALEAGDTNAAAKHLRRALQLREPGPGGTREPFEFNYAPVAEAYLKLLEEHGNKPDVAAKK